MSKANPDPLVFPVAADASLGVSPAADVLIRTLRDGAQKMLASAIEAEVAEYLAGRSHVVDDRGHRQVVRNGHLPTREILTGVGSIQVTPLRVHDRRGPEHLEILLRYIGRNPVRANLVKRASQWKGCGQRVRQRGDPTLCGLLTRGRLSNPGTGTSGWKMTIQSGRFPV